MFGCYLETIIKYKIEHTLPNILNRSLEKFKKKLSSLQNNKLKEVI